VKIWWICPVYPEKIGLKAVLPKTKDETVAQHSLQDIGKAEKEIMLYLGGQVYIFDEK